MESEPPAVAIETCDDEKLDGEPLGQEDECGESVEVRDDAAFTFGWDEEMMAAWRQPAGKKQIMAMRSASQRAQRMATISWLVGQMAQRGMFPQ